MKTINEQAAEYAKSISKNDTYREYLEKAFMAGHSATKKQSALNPISELVNDREACERIAVFFWRFGTSPEVVIIDDTLRIVALGLAIEIRVTDGFVEVYDDPTDEDEPIDYHTFNPFEFVALMNELGYGPEEMKQTRK